MPFGSFETTLCAIGLASVASARYFYSTKQTLPFKVGSIRLHYAHKTHQPPQLAYVASVMALGSGITLGVMPDTNALVKV